MSSAKTSIQTGIQTGAASSEQASDSPRSPLHAQDAHEALLLIAWRNAKRNRSVGWYFDFKLTVAGLPKVTHVLQVSELLSREDLAVVLAASGYPQLNVTSNANNSG